MASSPAYTRWLPSSSPGLAAQNDGSLGSAVNLEPGIFNYGVGIFVTLGQGKDKELEQPL